MTNNTYLVYILVMAGVTYLIRMLPLELFQRRLKNRFLRSFLFYVPYAVLAAMTIPEILYSTSSQWSALAGLLIAVILAGFERSLIVVALSACGTVFAVEWLLGALQIQLPNFLP